MTEEIETCPGCSCEPEVVYYLRDTQTEKRVGYRCTCGVVVVNGVVQGFTAHSN